MFAKANLIAREFTKPIVISSRMHDRKCNTGIGTYVVINEDGWFVTAYHIINQIMQLKNNADSYFNLNKQIASIKDDSSLKPHIKMGMINKMKILPNSITNYSVWMGIDPLSISNVFILPEIDLAIGRLENYNKAMIKTYPVFKDYEKPMDNGTSLCKLGFPFHSITPTFDEQNKMFRLPDGALPMPLFPLEGIYTRTVEIRHANTNIKFPLKYIETSSPGLRGQSGGPTFDVHGTIWAIQSQTKHYPLGFGDNTNGLTNKEAEHLKNQYLNVGLGIHSETIIEFCKSHEINVHLSDY